MISMKPFQNAVTISAFSLLSALPGFGEAWLRINQVGYLPDDIKIALLSSDEPLAGTFVVGPFRGEVGPDLGPWGPFAHNYRLDFTAFQTPGRYVVRHGSVESRPFVIAADAYARVPEKLLSFVRLQRCGSNPVSKQKCHQEDAIDVLTERQVDLVGGWHDAADRIKHMITTSYCVAALYRAGAHEEAAWGAELLVKIHPDPNTIYVQIGDDRDHGPPLGLWHEDQTDYGWGFGGPRAAWPATGQPTGPKYKNQSTGVASLAGRTAAVLALARRIRVAESLYALAQARPGCAMSVPVKEAYYYQESNYFDDLEWAATELHIATGKASYLRDAIDYAQRAGISEWMGVAQDPPASSPTTGSDSRPSDSLTREPAPHGHYEWFPYVNLAHWRLHGCADAATKEALVGYYQAALERVQVIAESNPYRLGTPLVWCSTNDVIAVATQGILYERMTGDRRFRALATEARDWIFGRNPWGVSFVVGVPENGETPRRPHHLFHRLAGYLPIGGLVDGPVTPQINARLKFVDYGEDRFARFQSGVGVYHDMFEDFSTNEPILDGTVSLLLLLHLWEH